MIHGFGACKEHWRNNKKILSEIAPCYSIDLIGFGNSSQPKANIGREVNDDQTFFYSFDSWAKQIQSFCESIIKTQVILIGNSIGGVIALKAATLLKKRCKKVILINCAVRTLDDKKLHQQPLLLQSIRPLLKFTVKQRWLSKALFNYAANPSFIKNVLKKAYPSGKNLDLELINMLYQATQRVGASEAFFGFTNIFNDYLAPELMEDMNIPVDLIWGDKDPWESIKEAQDWFNTISCICSLNIIKGAGHCPHDEDPENVNKILTKLIQQAK